MDTEKVVYYKRIGKRYCQIQFIIFLCAPNHPFEGYKFRIIVKENNFAAILHLKGNEVKIYNSLKVNKLTCFATS